MKITRKWIKVLTLVLVVVINLIASLISKPKTVTPPQEATPVIQATSSAEVKTLYRVEKVVDGDTIKVNIDGKTETVRLIGLDTPESVDSRRPVQCFAIEASNKAKELLFEKSVFLEPDATQGDKDKYGRLLRYVFMEDGSNFNNLMISEGYGHQYTYNKPYKYMEEFKLAELTAKNEKKGLWGEGVCVK